jgi:hypothetical protein
MTELELELEIQDVMSDVMTGSRLSPFSCTPVPSTLAMARQEEVERLEAGAPNPRHPAAQVP